MRRTHVAIVNVAAGGGRCAERAAPWLQRVAQEHPLVVHRTSGPGDATEVAATTDADVVIAVGGDGTLFEVVNGLMRRPAEARPALALLPLGTGNSFARDYGLETPEAAFAAIRRSDARPTDVLRVDHAGGTVWSINLVSVGFTAEAGALTNRRFKRFGVGGYVLAVGATLVRIQFPAFPLALDDGPRDDRPVTLLALCNSRFTGGTMMMAPNAAPDDGKFDVVRIGPMSRRRFASAFPRIFRGTHPQMSEVSLATGRRAAFALSGPVDVMIDGEVLPLQLTAVTVAPAAIGVIA